MKSVKEWMKVLY